MRSQVVLVKNALGLHARASAQLMRLALSYASDITLSYQGREANAKSIMELMLLSAVQGAAIECRVSGPDEEMALAAIVALVDGYFGENA